MKKSVIVIGSGISGLGISNMLQKDFTVNVLEKSAETGGLIKCRRINGSLFHLVGGHIFNSRNQAVLEWFWSFFDKEKDFVKASRNAKILMNGRIIGYPIENFIYQLLEADISLIITDLLKIASEKKDARYSNNFEDFLRQSFGSTLYDMYFGPYNQKIWNTDLREVPLDWLNEKLPMPSIPDILINNILKKQETGMVHASFYYPVRDGSQFIVNRLARDLDITLSYKVSSIAYRDGSISVNHGDKTCASIIYSGDVRKLYTMIDIADDELTLALEAVKDLPANGTSNVFCETDDMDISWLYLPEKKFAAHRIIYTGNFSETNNNSGGRKTCVVEFSGKPDKEQMVAELKLLPGNLEAIAFNYEAGSYIIHQSDTRHKINTLKKQLEKYNIYLLGRFAEWEYYNMDKCIEAAMALHQLLVKKI